MIDHHDRNNVQFTVNWRYPTPKSSDSLLRYMVHSQGLTLRVSLTFPLKVFGKGPHNSTAGKEIEVGCKLRAWMRRCAMGTVIGARGRWLGSRGEEDASDASPFASSSSLPSLMPHGFPCFSPAVLLFPPPTRPMVNRSCWRVKCIVGVGRTRVFST